MLAIYKDGKSGAPIYYWDADRGLLYQGGMSGSPIATLKGNKIYPNYGGSGSAIANIIGDRAYAGHFGAGGPPLATVKGNAAYYDYGGGAPYLMAEDEDVEGLLVAAAMAHDMGLPGGAEKLPNEMYDSQRRGQYDGPTTTRGDVFDAYADESMSDEDYGDELRRRAGIPREKSERVAVPQPAPLPKKRNRSGFSYIPCEGWDENGEIEPSQDIASRCPALQDLFDTPWEDLTPRERRVLARCQNRALCDRSLDFELSPLERRVHRRRKQKES
jgi:hypothetical protein